jgi:MYXO-CTERM domain-containing protein
VAESLADGSVLVAGGCTMLSCADLTDDAEVWDVSRDAFVSVAALPEATAGMVTARLPDGRILIAGGCTTTTCSSHVVAFERAANLADSTFTPLAPMNRPRARASVTTLNDGRILVTGGCTNIECTEVLADAEVYVPAEDRWVEVAAMGAPRSGHYAVTMQGGQVLVGGGCADQRCTTIHRSSELFDPGAGTFQPAATQMLPRFGVLAFALPNGQVLISQGCQTNLDCDLTNEYFDPGSVTFRMAEPAATTRGFHTLTHHVARNLLIAVGGCQPRTCSWWNETYDLGELTAPPDGGFVGADAGPPRDAGPPPPPPPPRTGGCSVPAGKAPPPWPGLLVFGVALWVRRRRSS